MVVPMPTLNLPGNMIRKARERAKLKQSDIAARLKVTRSAVGQWERGKTLPSTSHILELCDILDLDITSQIIDKTSLNIRRHFEDEGLLKETEIRSDGSSQNIGANVGALRLALMLVVDLLVEAGAFQKEEVANRFYAHATRSEAGGFAHQAAVLDELGGTAERERQRNEMLSEGSSDHPDLIVALTERVQSLEVSYRAILSGFMAVARSLEERGPAVAALRDEATRLRQNRDVRGQRTLERLAQELETAALRKA